MSYDWHFSDGSHTKMNNWQVHSAVMLLYHVMGAWSYKRLESELTAMQMHRNELNKTVQKMPDSGVEKLHMVISVETVDTDSELYKAARRKGMPIEEKDGVAYLAKVEFRGEKKPTKEFMKDFHLKIHGHLLYAIKNTMRCDELRDSAPKAYHSTFEKVLSNDGFVFDQKDAQVLMGGFFAIDKKMVAGLEEVLAEGWSELGLVCAYLLAKNLTAQIY